MLLLYHGGSGKIVLFDQGHSTDILAHPDVDVPVYGRISVCKNDIYFQYENYSFARIEDGKLIAQNKRLESNRGQYKVIIIDGKYYDQSDEYLWRDWEKIIRVPFSINHDCYAIFSVGRQLVCVFDHQPGYYETPSAFMIVVDITKNIITNTIKLGSAADSISWAHIATGKLLYLVFADCDENMCPAGRFCTVICFNGKSYTQAYVYTDKNGKLTKSRYMAKAIKKACGTAIVSPSGGLVYFSNGTELIVYDVVFGWTEKYPYAIAKDDYLHSVATI